MKIEEISFLKNYSTAKEPVGFMHAEKGAGAHAKSVIFYNQLIESLKLEKKYDLIQIGERFQYVYVKENSYSIEMVGFKDKWPEEFNEHFEIDRSTMFNKTVISPLKRFIALNKCSTMDLSVIPTGDIEDIIS